MTEKRFTVPKYHRCIQDNLTKEHYTCEDKTEAINLADLLNALHEENTRLQNEIQDFQNLLTEREETFLKPIYTALDDAILNERTALGKSALKQFKQTIME